MSVRIGMAFVALALAACVVACGSDDDTGAPPTASAATAASAAVTSAPANEGSPAFEGTPAPPAATANVTPLPPGEFRLTSSAFDDNGAIPPDFTCDGEDAIPPLTISGAPDNVATFAITVTDVDASGGEFVNWVAWDIPPASVDSPGGIVPPGGQEALTSHGPPGYFGPCPDSGEQHRYVFDLYALDTDITIRTVENGKAELLQEMEGHILAQAQLIGTYTRR